MMRVLVCGSRDWTNPDPIRLALLVLAEEHDLDLEVIHGAARGADRIAAQVCHDYGITVTAYPADWRLNGKRAGIIRNLTMLRTNPDLVLAFQRNGSRGTQHTIDEARRRGIPVTRYAGIPSDAVK